MGTAAHDIVMEQAFIKRDRFAIAGHFVAGIRTESSTPESHKNLSFTKMNLY
jgi:hypothetical protein